MKQELNRRTLVAALTLAGVAVSSPSWGQQPFKVGSVNPYSGPTALYGDEVTRGYELAAEWVNANGGILGRPVQIVRGNATNPQEGIGTVEQLAGRDKVDLFIGTYLSAVAAAASEAAMNYGKVYWDTNAIATNLTERGLPNFVRSGPIATNFADRSVEAVVHLLAPALGKLPKDLKVWLEHEDSIYGTTIAQRQSEALKAAGVQVAGVGAHSARAIDVTNSILRARNAQPDIWITTGYVPDNNLLLRTARDQGFRPSAMMLVGTGDTFETLEAMGKEALNGILIVGYPRADVAPAYGPGAAAYLDAYRKKYGKDPIAPQSMAAFVGFKIMAKTVNKAGSADPEKMRAAVAALDEPVSTYETGFGAKFDSKAQNTRALPTLAQWQDGKVATVFPKEAANAALIGVGRR